mgnify:CR=1 FL=1
MQIIHTDIKQSKMLGHILSHHYNINVIRINYKYKWNRNRKLDYQLSGDTVYKPYCASSDSLVYRLLAFFYQWYSVEWLNDMRLLWLQPDTHSFKGMKSNKMYMSSKLCPIAISCQHNSHYCNLTSMRWITSLLTYMYMYWQWVASGSEFLTYVVHSLCILWFITVYIKNLNS